MKDNPQRAEYPFSYSGGQKYLGDLCNAMSYLCFTTGV